MRGHGDRAARVVVLAMLVGVLAVTEGQAVTTTGGCGVTVAPWDPAGSTELTALVAAGEISWGVTADGHLLGIGTDGRPRTAIGLQGLVPGLVDAGAHLGASDGGVVLARGATEGTRRIELLRVGADGAPDPAFGTEGRATVELGGDADGTASPLTLSTADDGDLLLVTRVDASAAVARLRPDGTPAPGFGSDGVAMFDAEGAWPDRATSLPSGRIAVLGDHGGGGGLGGAPGVAWVLTEDGTLASDVGGDGRVDLDGPVGTQALVALAEDRLAFADAEPGGQGRLGTAHLGDGSVTAGALLPTPGVVRRVADRWQAATVERLGGFGHDVLVASRRDDDGQPVGTWGEDGTRRVDLAASHRLDLDLVPAVMADGSVHAVGTGADWDGAPVLVHVRVEPDGDLVDRHAWCPDDDRPAAPDVRRIAGDTRITTAVELSRAAFPDGADHVVLATGRTFPDALAGGPVATALGAPVLLVEPDGVPIAVADELRRLDAGAVTLLGGPVALSPAVADEVAAITGSTPRRLEGEDRTATAVAISRASFPPAAPVAFVVTGRDFPDALATGAIAGTLGGPILLTEPDGVPAATLAELDRLRPDAIVVVGGPVAVGDTADQLAAIHGDRVEVVAGEDRYETARRLVTRFRDEVDGHLGRPVTTVLLATGENFPDALAGAATAGTAGGVVALVPPATVDERLRDVLGRVHPRTLWVLGGPAAVSDVWPDALRRTGATSFTYIADPVAPDRPLRWDPCRPIHWVFNPDGAPDGGLELAQEGFARITEATGWQFTFAGLTDEPATLSGRSPYQPDRYGDRWAPVLVAWGRPPAGAVAGQAGPTWVDDVHVSGELVLNRDLSLPMTFDEGGWGDILLHEAGHVLGLDHPGDPTQTMYWTVVSGVSGLQPGDVAGLERLREGGCLDVPTPTRVPTRSTSRA